MQSQSLEEIGDEGSFNEPEAAPESVAPQANSLDNIINVIRYFINRFNSAPLHVDKSSARILDKYPKYLTKFSLLDLQFGDYLFRETFLVQVVIICRTLLANPTNKAQKDVFTTIG